MGSSKVTTRPGRDWPLYRLAWLVALLAVWIVGVEPAMAQRRRWDDEGHLFRRWIEIPTGTNPFPEIVVCQFFAHGAVPSEPNHVSVYTNGQQVPVRVLQNGPGDFCRIAFQTQARQSRYAVYYGGESSAPPPPWTSNTGLLLETRRWTSCNLLQFASVKRAFEGSERIGSDYVSAVFHRYHPFAPEPGPFLSRYVGSLHVPVTGNVAFFTSSQDASFLLVDGKLVVSWPGAHGPIGRARFKGQVTLSEGRHRFEYYHAAQGKACCMVASWQLPGAKQPVLISGKDFGNDRVIHLPAANLEHREEAYQPDFQMTILDDLPTPEGDSAMVRVQWRQLSADSLKSNARFQWHFGDGQTSTKANPEHVYLHTGVFQVTLAITRGARTVETTNRVAVHRQYMTSGQQVRTPVSLEDYLKAVSQYDVLQLDGESLVQLVKAYLRADQTERAAEAARAAFSSDASGQTDQSRWELARLIAPLLRYQMNQPKGAGEMWYAASRLVKRHDWRAAALAEAADILIHDLLEPDKAKPLLDQAKALVDAGDATTRSLYLRVLGDWYARHGQGDDARRAYRQADQARRLLYNETQRIAWRGAHSRSVEAFLQEGQLDRAREELDRWQRDFPADKLDGYLAWLQMRCWIAMNELPQAIAVAAASLTVSPNSPYADRLAYQIAQCERLQGHTAQAIAALQSFLADYPGSHFTSQARQELEELKQQSGSNVDRSANSPN